MATAFDVIASSLRLANVLADSELPNDDIANQGLAVLNDMLDAWNAERLAVFTMRADDFPLVAGQQAYTLGTTGNFNITRPARIERMSVVLLANPANPVEVPITMYTFENWQNVAVKVAASSFPLACYDDANFPLRTLNFWPLPQQVNNVRIYSWSPLPAQTLLSALAFPPGYAEALRYNLAVRLAAEFVTVPNSTVISIAVQGYARIKSMNLPSSQMRSDLVNSQSGYNYRADMFGMGF